MGGKLLSNTRRYSKLELDDAARFILSSLRESGYKCDATLAYEEKETFGDLDIVVSYTGTDKLEALVQELFKPEQIVNDPNQNILSFSYNDLSVDLIFVRDDIYDFAHSYLSYSDLGNLVGKTAHMFGVHVGTEGMWYRLREDKHIIGKIVITKNWYLALRILGFEPNTYALGFKSKLDIFNFVTSGKFFNFDFYTVKLNAKARASEKKRDTYREFIQHCQNTELKQFTPPKTFKQNFLRYLLSDPKFKSEYDALISRNNQKKKLKLRFSGDIVKSLTGLSGEKLGAYLKYLKDFDLYSMNSDNIKRLIVNQLPIFEELYYGTARTESESASAEIITETFTPSAEETNAEKETGSSGKGNRQNRNRRERRNSGSKSTEGSREHDQSNQSESWGATINDAEPVCVSDSEQEG